MPRASSHWSLHHVATASIPQPRGALGATHLQKCDCEIELPFEQPNDLTLKEIESVKPDSDPEVMRIWHNDEPLAISFLETQGAAPGVTACPPYVLGAGSRGTDAPFPRSVHPGGATAAVGPARVGPGGAGGGGLGRRAHTAGRTVVCPCERYDLCLLAVHRRGLWELSHPSRLPPLLQATWRRQRICRPWS